MSKSKQPNLPQISKTDFVDLIHYIKNTNENFDKLQDAMETVSPGSYVDFWPHAPMLDRIIDLLAIIMGEGGDSPFDPNLIEYFIYDLEYGTKALEYRERYDLDALDTPTTPEELYDALVKLHFSKDTDE